MKIIYNKKKKRFFLLEKDEEIGYLTYEYPDDAAGKRNVNLLYLYVKPFHRRKGLAKKLLKYALKAFKNVIWISFWTGKEAEIDKSYPLYRKVGFK
jgi:GNAT superfamily N-acetyltransferase